MSLCVQFGANDNLLDGWINLRNETDGDITKRLNFEDATVDFILIEHVVEHVTPLQGFRFFKECRRILKRGGVLRVIVPDVKSIWEKCDDDYLNFIDGSMDQWWRAAGESPPPHPCSRETAFETILCCHGHKAAYTPDLLFTFLRAAGFRVDRPDLMGYGNSIHLELENTDSHWRQMGIERVKMESVVAEGTKP